MRQAVLSAPGKLEVREVPLPLPADGELVVRIDLALTCGTDLKTWRRGHPKLPLPTPLGHEYTGTVAAAGRGVSRFRPGDPILAVPSAPCGDCPPCRRGDLSLCDRIDGTTMAWGAFADFIRLPAHVVRRNVFHRPPGLDLRLAALLEPLSCVVAGVERLDLRRVETALVLGAGPIGLLYVALLKHRGVPRVIALGKRRIRLEAARRMGADLALDLEEGDARQLVEAAVPGGPCAVVECVGRPEAWLLAADLARKGGEVLLYGGCPAGTRVPFDAQRLHYDALTLKGAFHFAPADVRIALDLIRRRALPLEGLVDGRLPLDRLAEAFARLEAGECLKLAIVPGEAGGEG